MDTQFVPAHENVRQRDMSHFRRLSKDVLIYGVGNILLRFLGFITIPIFTRIFSPADYGTIETIGALVSAIALFATLSLDSASQRSYFDYSPHQQSERQTVLSTTFWTLLIWSVGLALLGGAASSVLAALLLGDSSYGLLIAVAVIGVPVIVINTFFQEILRLWHQPVRYTLVSMVGAVLIVGWALYLVAIRSWGLMGNYVGALMGGLFTLGVSYWFVRGAIRFIFSGRELRVMLVYGLPLIPTAISVWVLQLADRFFLLRYALRDELGLYGLGVRLSNLLMLGVGAFSIAWSPFILELYSRDPVEEARTRARALTYLTWALALGALCISIFAREFFLIVTTPAFVNAYRVVGLLSGTIIIIGMNTIVMTGITLTRQTHYFARYTIIAALINTVLNLLLIPPLGILGAALATLLSYTSLFVFYYRCAQKLSPASYDVRGIVTILLTATGLIALGTVINLSSLWFSVAVKALLILAFPMLVWLLGGLDPRELSHLRTLALKQVVRVSKQKL